MIQVYIKTVYLQYTSIEHIVFVSEKPGFYLSIMYKTITKDKNHIRGVNLKIIRQFKMFSCCSFPQNRSL